MRKTVLLLARAVVALALPSLASAQTVDAHYYAVPSHGSLGLVVPPGLREFSKPLAQPPAVNIRFQPETGDAFYVQVTSVWLDAAKLATATPDSVKGSVKSSGEDSLRQSVEKQVVLKELHGAETRGFYYSLTDRAPGPGEYGYMSQGVFVTGELMTTFTILHRDAACPEKEIVLQMFAAAKYVK